LGGSAAESVDGIKVDQAGNAFVVGATGSVDFPVPGSRSSSDSFGVFVAKISPDGSSLIYNTFLEGSDSDGVTSFDVGFQKNDIAIDNLGNAYIAGVTESGDFPVSDNAYQKVRLCSRQFGFCIFPEEAFAAKLDAEGEMVYSTFIGGRNTDYANGIAIDSSGRAYIAGATESGAAIPNQARVSGNRASSGPRKTPS
jgi:hypothetical protein